MLADLIKYTGALKSVNVIRRDEEGGTDRRTLFREYYSNSRLKDFLDKPATALARHVLKTIPPKVYKQASLDNFRVGNAIHALCFEGPEVFKQSFPVFTGTARKGTAWDKFCEQFPAAKNDRGYLQKKELESVLAVGKNGYAAFQALCGQYKRQGWDVLGIFPEVTFLCEFEKVKLGAQVDALMLVKAVVDGRDTFLWAILEGKSTSKSVEAQTSLGFAIEDLGYDMQAVMYAYLVGESLRWGSVWKHLLGGEYGAGDYSQITGTVNHLWFDKDTTQVAWDMGFLSYPNTDGNEWAENGTSKVCRSLFNIQSQMRDLQSFLGNAPGGDLGKLKADAPPVLYVKVPVPRNAKYARGDRLAGLGEIPQALPTLAQARGALGAKYAEPAEPLPPLNLSLGGSGADAPPPLPEKEEEEEQVPVKTAKKKRPVPKKVDGVFVPENVITGTCFPSTRLGFADWVDKTTKAELDKRRHDWLKLGVEYDLGKGEVRSIRSQIKKQLLENFTPYSRGDEGDKDE